MTTPDERRARVQAELAELTAPRLTHDDAWRIGELARTIAAERFDRGVSIRVERGDQLVFASATAGTSADNDDWIARKTRVVRRLGIASLVARLRRDASGAYSWLDPAEHALSGGCVPITVAGGAIVGTITVSGLADEDDHAVAVAAIRRWIAELD